MYNAIIKGQIAKDKACWQVCLHTVLYFAYELSKLSSLTIKFRDLIHSCCHILEQHIN